MKKDIYSVVLKKAQLVRGKKIDIDSRDKFIPKQSKVINLEWNVFNEENGKIVVCNVFDLSWKFNEYIKKAYKKYPNNFGKLAKEVHGWLMNQMWCRCEYEIVLNKWPSRKDSEGIKIDVYSQIMINWENFINYVWENRKLIKKI